MSARLFRSEAGSPRGVVLVAHGLNTRPEAMDCLINVLLRRGFHCQRVSFHQGAPTRRAPSGAVVDGWMRAFAGAHAEASSRCAGCPMYCLGFSLGALIALRFLDTRPATFKAMFLLAPPVALTRSANVVRLLTPLSRIGGVLPSAAAAEVRARRATPLAEYAGMLVVGAALQHLERAEQLNRIPTSIVLDEDDELVSYAGVSAWMRRNRLERWTLAGLGAREPTGRTFRHLMITEQALGRSAWGKLTHDVVAQFELHP